MNFQIQRNYLKKQVTQRSLLLLLCCMNTGCGGRSQSDASKMNSLPEPLIHSSTTTILNEVAQNASQEGLTECQQTEKSTIIYKYLADQVGQSLRKREYCFSNDLLKNRLENLSKVTICEAQTPCGHAEIHQDLPSEIGIYLAMIDLAIQGAPMKIRSMKKGYQDQNSIGQRENLIRNPNLEVSRTQQQQTQVGRQELLFTLGSQGRCLYWLKTFREVSRDELVYQGLKDLTTYHLSDGISATRYHLRQNLTQEHHEVLFLVDSSLEGGGEDDLLQHRLLCKFPRDVLLIDQISGVSMSARDGTKGQKHFEVRAPLISVPPHQEDDHRKELSDRFKAQAHVEPMVEVLQEAEGVVK